MLYTLNKFPKIIFNVLYFNLLYIFWRKKCSKNDELLKRYNVMG